MAQMVKNLPTVQETWVRSLGWEDPLEKEMATYLLENSMDRVAWQAIVHRVAELDMTERQTHRKIESCRTEEDTLYKF